MNKGTNETGNKVGTFDGGDWAHVFNAAGAIVGEIEKHMGNTIDEDNFEEGVRVESYTVSLPGIAPGAEFKVNGRFVGGGSMFSRTVTDGYKTARKALAAAKAYAKTAQPAAAPEAPEAPEAEEAAA